MSEITTIIQIIVLTFSMALVLWGLKIFKLYIRVIGFFIGVFIGIIVIIYVKIPIEYLPWISLVFAIIGVIIAWPLHKAFIFIFAGILAATLIMILCKLFELSNTILQIAGILSFILGGIIAIIFYDYLIILLMAWSGAIYVYLFSSFVIFDNFFEFNYLIEYYTKWIVSYILILTQFIIFAIYYQKSLYDKESKSEEKNQQVKITRIVVWVLGFYCLLVYFFPHSTTNSVGLSIRFWPIQSAIMAFVLIMIYEKIPNIRYNFIIKYILLSIYIWVIFPVLNYTYFFTVVRPKFDNPIFDIPNEQIVSTFFNNYFSRMICVDEYLVFKVLFSLILIPASVLFLIEKDYTDKKVSDIYKSFKLKIGLKNKAS